ncbi:MAG: LamG domain-containing protein [Verrucomicrobiae bacterium]|nr:LamG domain-containing protein [Verrucomicrobiae bacterium]
MNSVNDALIRPPILAGVSLFLASLLPVSADTLFSENFDGLAGSLEPFVSETESGGDGTDWTAALPEGWSRDNSGVPDGGVEEFAGWTFLDPVSWDATAQQNRVAFTKGQNVILVADGDEWDDSGPGTRMETTISTPAIALAGVTPGTLALKFDSSWNTEPQFGWVRVSFDVGDPVELLAYDESTPTALDDTLVLPVTAPAGATTMTVNFTYEAGNNWWWAIDNIVVTANEAVIVAQPSGGNFEVGQPTTLSVSAIGEGLTYQWFKVSGADRVAVNGATAASLEFAALTVADSGTYSVDISSGGNTVTSDEVLIVVDDSNGKTVLFAENFDGLVSDLGPFVSETESNGDGTDWTATLPTGWTRDNSGVPAGGVEEFAGWTFFDPVSWDATAQQNRVAFTKGKNVILVADGDEWDDSSPGARMQTIITTPAIPLAGAEPNGVTLNFDSSWNTEPQTGIVSVSFDGGAAIELLRYEEATPSNLDESVSIPVNNPAGATSMTVSFTYEAGNNWWWAIDNITVTAGEPVAPPAVVVFSENFDGIELGESVDEGNFAEEVWSNMPPEGWSVDNSNLAGLEDGLGVTEWRGWNFADPVWWASVDDQRRSEFTKASGVAAIADPDEWDDLGSPSGSGTFNSFLSTPEISLQGIAGALTLTFDSSFRPEGAQRATVGVKYDAAEEIILLDWVSTSDDKTNESVVLPLQNPDGAQKMVITFGMSDAGNNWFWAIDNIEVTTGAVPILPSNLAAAVDAATKMVTLTWSPGANLGGQSIEVLRGGEVIGTVPVGVGTYVDSPPGVTEDLIVFDYGIRVTGNAESLVTKKAVFTGSAEPVKIAQWDFNEAGGLTTENSVSADWQGKWYVGRDFPGEAGDEPTWQDADTFGGAIAFEGAGYFDLGDFDATAGLRPVAGVTVAAWVNPYDLVDWAGILNVAFDSGSSEAGYYLGTRGGTDFHFAVTTEDNPTLDYLRAPGALDQWQYVVGTFDGQTIRLYIDGVEANSAEHPGLIKYESIAGDTPLGVQIGVFLDDNEEIGFGGSIAHVAVWDGALSAATIAELYQKGLTGDFGAGSTGPKITKVQLDAERRDVTLTWSSRNGKTYSVETAPDAQDWIEVDDGIEATGESTTFTDSAVDAAVTQRYYRVIEQ